jgi:hypothetical protein
LRSGQRKPFQRACSARRHLNYAPRWKIRAGATPRGGCRRGNPDFPDGSVGSVWRLRLFLVKPSVFNDFLLKQPSNPMGENKNDPFDSISTDNSSWNSTAS